MKKLIVLGAVFFAGVGLAWTRPLFTEEASTRGHLNFETGTGLWSRWDDFKSPETDLETVLIPVRVRLGITEKFDLGFGLTHASQRLERNNVRLSGSQNGQLSTELKWKFWDRTSFLFNWGLSNKDDDEETLPIARGNDLEFLFCHTLKTEWPIHFNAGYVARGDYNTNFGVTTSPQTKVKPGDIVELAGSMETPLAYNIFLLTEILYNRVDKRSIGGNNVDGSEGEALDALVGLTWNYKNWNLGAGAGFGLLDESHTSFALDRGQGDISFKINLSYILMRSQLQR